MKTKLKILGINGSASQNSSNLTILRTVAKLGKVDFDAEIIDDLSKLPPFRTELADNNTPEEVIKFRNQIETANGVIICTPEYVFSIPSRLKNAIEWCVSTTVFSAKPTVLITASASGKEGHEELKLIMKTVQANITKETTLLIQGVKSKVNSDGDITDDTTVNALEELIKSLSALIRNS